MARNFFSYFPVSRANHAWGLHATSFGKLHVPPHAAYPPQGHPASHHFAWDQGRTLQEYQLLYIHAGRGQFESSLTRKRTLSEGNVFLLFPGIWHRYRPDRATGWTESWIELNGSYIDQLHANGMIDPRKPVHQVQSVGEIEDYLEAADHLARAKPSGFQARLGLLAVQILILVQSNSGRRQTVPRRISGVVSEAQALLAGSLEKNPSAEQTARRLGVSYSYFRKEFKRQTGFSPKQYQIEIRDREVRDLLRNSTLTIKEISERLGYYSPYHLSLEFSKRNGMPPLRWRRARGAK